MITYVVSDLFQSPAKVLVNTVNTVGVMGKGIALDFKKIYPEMFKQYQEICERKLLDTGKLWIYKTEHKWVLNFPTKKHWRSKSKLEYIEAGLKKFVDTYDDKGITSISFPMLGCGNGELDWETQVRPLMEHYLDPLPIKIYVHLYTKDNPFAPEHRNLDEIKQWLRNEPESLGFVELWEDLTGVIRTVGTFETLSGGEEFTAEYVKATEVIVFTKNPEVEFVEKEQILDFWQQFRAAGYYQASNFSAGLDKSLSYIVPLFASLSYVRPILLSDHSEPTDRDIGLRLVPKSELSSPLFSKSRIQL